LPGSSIEIAYDDPIKFYADIQSSGKALLQEAWTVVQKISTFDSTVNNGAIIVVYCADFCKNV
jgi:hypothetical protein